jgi:hypothetical protein
VHDIAVALRRKGFALDGPAARRNTPRKKKSVSETYAIVCDQRRPAGGIGFMSGARQSQSLPGRRAIDAMHLVHAEPLQLGRHPDNLGVPPKQLAQQGAPV